LIAYIHVLYAKILQVIILSTVRPFMYLAGVKVGFEGLTTAQRDQGNDLMRELAQAVKSRSAYSQVTVPLAPLYWLPMSADCALVNSSWIDMAHHMSYDFDVGSNGVNGPWRVTGTQQYLYPG